jgi:tryptophan-rich sensory protein
LGVHVYIIAGISVFISGYVLASKFKFDTKSIIQNLVFGFLLALVARIIFDTLTISSTSHNLAPLEILIIFLIVSIASTIGSKVGELN